MTDWNSNKDQRLPHDSDDDARLTFIRSFRVGLFGDDVDGSGGDGRRCRR
jgi:hypothetical protein